MELKDKAASIALLRAGFGRELQEAAYRSTAPIFWADPGTSSPKFNSGSVFFIDCGKGPFAVTANHVIDAYLDRRLSEPNLSCQVGRLRFHPEDRIIDQSVELDVATLRISAEEVAATAKWLHHEADWPPKPPDVGRGVFFAGFPRIARQEEDGAVTFGAYSFLLTATTVTEATVKCVLDREAMIDMGGGLPPEPLVLGGMSGAPLWTLVDRPVVRWRLAGILTDYQENLEVFFARTPDCIEPDGRLRHL